MRIGTVARSGATVPSEAEKRRSSGEAPPRLALLDPLPLLAHNRLEEQADQQGAQSELVLRLHGVAVGHQRLLRDPQADHSGDAEHPLKEIHLGRGEPLHLAVGELPADSKALSLVGDEARCRCREGDCVTLGHARVLRLQDHEFSSISGSGLQNDTTKYGISQ